LIFLNESEVEKNSFDTMTKKQHELEMVNK